MRESAFLLFDAGDAMGHQARFVITWLQFCEAHVIDSGKRVMYTLFK